MKAFDFTHWDPSEDMKGLLFFAQSLEEMLFHYGHDSLKVPALNFRFLCVEIESTIKKILSGVVDKGNLKPLLEELEDCYAKDPIAISLYGADFKSLFYQKSSSGEFQRDCASIFKDPSSDASLPCIRKVISYLLNDMEIGDKYYIKLKEAIENSITKKPFDYEEESKLYKLSKILLTELINFSYSQEYIYYVVNGLFYNENKSVTDISAALEQFWKSFDFQEKDYTVILPLKEKQLKTHLDNFQNVTVSDADGHFTRDYKWEMKLPIRAMDPPDARDSATKLVSFYVSLLQYNNHKSKTFHAYKAIVFDVGTNTAFELQESISPLKRGVNLGTSENNQKVAAMVENFSAMPRKLVSVIELHSSAVNDSDIGNQLLNLWTIVEILIQTQQKNSYSKINQICNVFTSVLNSQYIASLITQLIDDLKRCAPALYTQEIEQITLGSNECEKLTALLILPTFSANKNNLLAGLKSYPLLQFRVEQYSNIFSDRKKIKRFLDSHRERLNWQIMRIYRNRNMIVHDGSHFPYIEIIVQNLHFYIDSLIDAINEYLGKGYNSIQTIYTAIQQSEYKHLILLEKKKQDGAPLPVTTDFIEVVLSK